MSISFTAPAGQMRLAGDIINHSLSRGDWDEDASDELAPATTAFYGAADGEDDDEPVTAQLTPYLADEMSAILGSDVAAGGPLHELLASLDAAIAASWKDHKA